MLREKLGEYLGGVAVADRFQFLKCIGKKLAVVKAKQEAELELKSFAPPYALYPELYLLPRVEYFEDVHPLSSSTQQRHHFNVETNRYGHGARLPNLPQQKTESKQFLESTQSSHQLESQKVLSPAEWAEKEPLPVLHTSHEQDHNEIIETQTQFRVKGKFNVCSEGGWLLQYRTGESVTVLGDNLDDQANENKYSDPTCPKEHTFPPLPPLLALSVNTAQVPAAQAEVDLRIRLTKPNSIMFPCVAREEWKKKYFETKKATFSLEDVFSKLQQDLELYHQKLLLQLEARNGRKQPKNTTNLKNNRIIQITTVQHELDQLRRKLDDTKMKLVIEIKMRKQALADLRALRAELTQKKIHSALILQSTKSGM
ncbi:hypothetical protein ASZ78_012905 [Callipepla squamata]|uniref:Spermatogenesis-associated protein 1 C-terminal domain-containing protein n=1 Tax=Callipepla squamata TaxID=9009 RepID=A0A226MJK6_CALSU|nr:hypothetical protein ASZ78_012905 [Callipepla squamata]